MATFTRTNAWSNGGSFDNPTLLWYAKGVGVLQGRALNDLSSWWFFAAMHGEYIKDSEFPGWGSLPDPPNTPTTPQPAPNIWKKYWDQCQHQSWFFLPWHRGYLIALEAQIRAAVISQGGPSDWALPYWNCCGPGNQSKIPPAFTATKLPDGSANPLFVKARYGPESDGNIYVPVPPVSQDVISNDLFSGGNVKTKAPGFGGRATGFSHQGGQSGNVEANPHNLVHGFVGGDAPSGPNYGLMSDPGIAALDPVFYVHHCNIDRIWAAWNNAGNANPKDPNWLKGPGAHGQRQFVMPIPGNDSWVYTPEQMDSLSKVNYTYDDLPAIAPAKDLLSERLTRLGAFAAAARVEGGAPVAQGENEELVGSNDAALPITGGRIQTEVKLAPEMRNKIAASLNSVNSFAAAPGAATPPDRVFLHLENVRGTHDAAVLNVYVNLPPNANPEQHPDLKAGTISMFGLRRASAADGEHAGEGLNFTLDITPIVDQLHLRNQLNTDAMQVTIVPHRAVPDQAEVTVGRVSVYRVGN